MVSGYRRSWKSAMPGTQPKVALLEEGQHSGNTVNNKSLLYYRYPIFQTSTNACFKSNFYRTNTPANWPEHNTVLFSVHIRKYVPSNNSPRLWLMKHIFTIYEKKKIKDMCLRLNHRNVFPIALLCKYKNVLTAVIHSSGAEA